MKQLSLLLTFLVVSVFATQASNADLFSYDEAAITEEFSDLTALEGYVMTNQEVTFNDLVVSDQLASFNLDENILSGVASPMFGFEDIDWGSFAWGFCCWPIGLFVVVFNSNKDSDQKLSFWIGLGVSWAMSLIGGLAA